LFIFLVTVGSVGMTLFASDQKCIGGVGHYPSHS
jgi:hypothetical protein